jgi:hypothetical protein
MSTTKPRASKKARPAAKVPVVVAYKGFDKDLQCRDYQYAVGQTFEHKGKVKACKAGFHACEHPLDVFEYYAPAGSRFAEVELSGESSREANGDTKIAAARIHIKAEISLPTLIQRAVEWVMARCTPEGETATGYQGAASATGYQGAAMSSGYGGSVMAAEGNAMFLAERDDDYKIVAVWAGIAGRDGIRPNVWYTLKGGKPVEVAA